MGASVELATGISSLPITIFLVLFWLSLPVFIAYERYANILKWLTLALLAYVAVLFVVKIDWMATIKACLAVFPDMGPSRGECRSFDRSSVLRLPASQPNSYCKPRSGRPGFSQKA